MLLNDRSYISDLFLLNILYFSSSSYRRYWSLASFRIFFQASIFRCGFSASRSKQFTDVLINRFFLSSSWPALRLRCLHASIKQFLRHSPYHHSDYVSRPLQSLKPYIFWQAQFIAFWVVSLVVNWFYYPFQYFSFKYIQFPGYAIREYSNLASAAHRRAYKYVST